jgi:hypothetical protein
VLFTMGRFLIWVYLYTSMAWSLYYADWKEQVKVLFWS